MLQVDRSFPGDDRVQPCTGQQDAAGPFFSLPPCTFPLTTFGTPSARKPFRKREPACAGCRWPTGPASGSSLSREHRAPCRRTRALLRSRICTAYIVSMRREPDLRSIPDEELLRRVSGLLRQSRRAEADLIAHISEVDARRLYTREAASSMFVWCTEVLHLSEFEAYLRIAVARASREHPMLLTMLRDGRLHLTAIAKLAPHLTRDNRQTLLKRAAHKSKRQIEELVAELAPRPEAPAVMRKLPGRRGETAPVLELRPGRVASGGSGLGPDRAATSPVLPQTRPAVVEPVAPARYRVQFTASTELREKLQRLQALMRSSVPDGDLATIIEQAVTEKLERLESKRFGKTKTPRKTLSETDTLPSSRHIPAAVRRAVYERDKGQCTYVEALGRRCKARDRLEFHHHGKPYGRGGNHSPENLRLTCRAHNALFAERDYGKEKMARYRRSGNRVSEATAVYAIGHRAAGASSPPSPQSLTGRSPICTKSSAAATST